MRGSSLRHLWLVALAVLAPLACSDSTGPDPYDPTDVNALGLAVGVRMDSAAVRDNGEFALELIPSTPEGASLVNEAWTTTVKLSGPYTATLQSQTLQIPDLRPFAAAVSLDGSASMLYNDPDFKRKDAARLFAETILGENPASRLSLFEFATQASYVTPGWVRVWLMQDWTTSLASFDTALAGMLTPNGTGTPLYATNSSIIRWMDTTTSAAGERRALLLLTDGLAEDPLVRDSLFDVAMRTGTVIYTVGIGAGSDRSANSDPAAVVELQGIADATGGLYAGAATPDRLSGIFQAFATTITESTILASLVISPIPPSGTVISGTVRMENSRGIAQASFSFVVP
jgi:hypothetical protein